VKKVRNTETYKCSLWTSVSTETH